MGHLRLPLFFLVVISVSAQDIQFPSDDDDFSRPVTQVILPISQRLGETEKNINDTILEIFNNCTCVMYYLCDDENYIIKDGRGLIVPRTRGNPILCTDTSKACCKEKPVNTISTSTFSSTSSTITSTTTLAIPNVREPTTKQKKISCGLQRTAFSARILNTDDYSTSLPGEFPWLAEIFKKISGKYEHICGGTLIHPKVVLTGMHYIRRSHPQDLKVIVNGKNEISNIGDNSDDERVVSEVITHPNFYAGGLYNNIALLILENPFKFDKSSRINTLCLPQLNMVYENMGCLVAGFGKGSHNNSSALKRVDVPLVDHSTCQTLLRKTRLGSHFYLHESFVCAGGEEDKDACYGDGGYPLMCKVNDRYQQVGIVSWGIGCGTKDVPGVYTNVPMFLGWIQTELSKRQIVLSEFNFVL